MKSTGIVPRSAKDQRISVRGAQAPGLGGSISGRPGGCREHRIDPPARGFVGYKGPRQGTDPLSYQLLRPVGCPGLAMPRPDAPWGLGRPAARPGARPPPRARRPRALEQAVAIRVTLPDGQLGVSPIFAGASSRIWARLPRRCWSCCGRRTKTRGCRHAVRSSIGR